MTLPILTDTEIQAICEPLTQGHAQIRYLRKLGVPVERKPNGRPLVRRVDWERRSMLAQNEPSQHNGPKWRTAA